jgi:hypothetical protein
VRGWVRPGVGAISSILALAGGIACNAILDNHDATYVEDAAAAPEACGDGGYPCGSICVSPGDPAYGCSIDSNCRPCAFAHGTGACNGASCALATCDPGYEHCSQDPASGCETNVTTDDNNCGRCGNMCGPGASCSKGACAQGCQPPKTVCGSSCVNLDDPSSCGQSCALYAPCPPPADPSAIAVCDAGACGVACDIPGDIYCNGQGYCANVLTDNFNCGVCGYACPPSATCQNAECCTAGGTPCQVGIAPCCSGIYLGACTDAGLCCAQPQGQCFGNGDCCSGMCTLPPQGPPGTCL